MSFVLREYGRKIDKDPLKLMTDVESPSIFRIGDLFNGHILMVNAGKYLQREFKLKIYDPKTLDYYQGSSIRKLLIHRSNVDDRKENLMGFHDYDKIRNRFDFE